MSQQSVVSHRDPAQRRTLTVLVISQVLGTIGLGVAPSIGILLAGDVTHSEAWAGLARTGSTLGAALLGIPLGNLAARRGRRLALTTGWWLAAAGAAILVAAAQWQLVVPLFLGLLLTGAGTATALQARFTATDLATPTTRARALALVVWMGAIGNVLGPNLGVVGEVIGDATGIAPYGAAFGVASIGSALAGLAVLLFLRPDPLRVLAERLAAERPAAERFAAEGLTAEQAAADGGGAVGRPDLAGHPAPVGRAERIGRAERFRRAAAELSANRRARTALVALLTAQGVMVALMTMTPVHLAHHGGSLTIIGLTISLHIAGMYGLAPVVGWLADRLGHRAVVAMGIGILAVSMLLAVVVADSHSGVMASLVLLGLGWSFMNVAASALFSAAVTGPERASAQGAADALSNLCGALAAFASGPLMAVSSFSALAVVAAVAMVPILVLVLRPSAWRPTGSAAGATS